jgi:hypothetical protein
MDRHPDMIAITSILAMTAVGIASIFLAVGAAGLFR